MPRRAADQPASRRTTIRDVARQAGVSVATVSRVLAGNYPTAAATRAKVMRAVRDLDYVANAHARALAGQSPKLVAILVSSVTTPFYAAVAQGVEEQAAQEGRLSLVCSTAGETDRELAIVKLMREQGADAVILVGGVVETEEYQTRMAQYAQALDAAGSCLVLCGRPALRADVPALVAGYDNEGGAHAAVSHLLSAGHRRVAFLGGDAGNTTTDDRIAGWRRAHRDWGFDADPELVLPFGGGEVGAYQAVRAHLAAHEGRPNFTAALAYDDHIAVGVMKAVREAGLRVPDDLSVVGYDDVPMAAHTAPPLTTVRIPAEELGRTAVRMALHTDHSPATLNKTVTVGTHIVIRETVASLRATEK